MAYRITVDPDVCISSGKCVADAPQLFRFDDDEIAQVIPGAEVPSNELALDIARNCPAGAIKVFDGDKEIDLY